MITTLDARYGPESVDRPDAARDAGPAGAEAALASFYVALNHRDPAVLDRVWATDPLVQLDNPVGGILRGHGEVTGLYRAIFAGPVRLSITFGDIVAYTGDAHAVFTGRETGTYTGPDGVAVPLEIRTSRYFRYEDGRWRQYHHHGSIDDPAALAAYQAAVRGGTE